MLEVSAPHLINVREYPPPHQQMEVGVPIA